MIRNVEREILSGMQTGAVHMALYDDLYKCFRKIRHDFANYIQSSQYDSEDEDFILRLRMLKKGTLEETNDLLSRLEELPFDLDIPHPDALYPELRPAKAYARMKPREEMLFSLWEDLKQYFISQQAEFSRMREVLLHLQDRLERSLPPDERESRVHLEECDSIKCHMTADTVLLSAYTYVFRRDLDVCGSDFRFRLQIPPEFDEATGDLYYLLGAARRRALLCLANPEADQGGLKKLTRISFATGLGLWHFSLEYGYSTQNGEEKLPGSVDLRMLLPAKQPATGLPLSNQDKTLKKILKRHKALFTETVEDGMIKIDVVG